MHYIAVERPSYIDLRDSYLQWILRLFKQNVDEERSQRGAENEHHLKSRTLLWREYYKENDNMNIVALSCCKCFYAVA
jgi:hypothetical protein